MTFLSMENSNCGNMRWTQQPVSFKQTQKHLCQCSAKFKKYEGEE